MTIDVIILEKAKYLSNADRICFLDFIQFANNDLN